MAHHDLMCSRCARFLYVSALRAVLSLLVLWRSSLSLILRLPLFVHYYLLSVDTHWLMDFV